MQEACLAEDKEGRRAVEGAVESVLQATLVDGALFRSEAVPDGARRCALRTLRWSP